MPYDPKKMLDLSEVTNDSLNSDEGREDYVDTCEELYMEFREEFLTPHLRENQATLPHLEILVVTFLQGFYSEFRIGHTVLHESGDINNAEVGRSAYADFQKCLTVANMGAKASLKRNKS